MGHMAYGWAERLASRTPSRDGASTRLLLLAWVLLACATLILLVPARYTVRSTLSFDVAAQPAATTVRGMAQVLTSKEMAFEVLDRLSRADAALLGVQRRLIPLPQWLGGEDRPARDRAASRLTDDLSITPRHGGRTLELAFTAERPGLATRVMQTYFDTFAALQAGARSRAPGMAEAAIPPLAPGAPALEPRFRDLPPLSAGLGLAGFALALAILTIHARRQRTLLPVRTRHDLPSQTQPARRVAWMDAGRGAGLTCEDAVQRLAEQVISERDKGDARLVVLTSEVACSASATCAIGLARHLADEHRVALVALDGASGDLGALVSDPWAPGMGEMLFGVAGFGEAIHRDPQSRAHVIPPGRDARGGASVVGADRLLLILNALRQTYDFVVVAAPVLGGTVSAARLAQFSPLVVCIEDMDADAAPNVEAYDALAALGFGRVLMLRIDAEPPRATGDESGEAQRLIPSLSAA